MNKSVKLNIVILSIFLICITQLEEIYCALTPTPLIEKVEYFQDGTARLHMSANSNGVTNFWQTTALGTSTNNGNSIYTVSTEGTYYLRAISMDGWSESASVVVRFNNCPAPSNITHAGCPGEEFGLNINSNSSAVTEHKWYTSTQDNITSNIVGEALSSMYFSTYTKPGGFSSSTYLLASSVCGSEESGQAVIKVDIGDGVTPTVSLIDTKNPTYADVNGNYATICNNTTTLKAKITGGGTSPKYTWKRGGIPIPGRTLTSANEYLATGVINGEVFSVEMESNASCISGATSRTSSLRAIVPSVKIEPLCTSIEKGKTLSANPEDASSPSYVWKINGVQKGTNRSLVMKDFDDHSIISVEMSTQYCNGSDVFSAETPPMRLTYCTPTVSISCNPANKTINTGEVITFNANPSANAENPTYVWKVNNREVETGPSYSETLLENRQSVSLTMYTTNACQKHDNITTNTGPITVNPCNIPGGELNQTSCLGVEEAIQLSAIGTNITGINWYSNPDDLDNPLDNVTNSKLNAETHLTSYTKPGGHSANATYYVQAQCGSIESDYAIVEVNVIDNVNPSVSLRVGQYTTYATDGYNYATICKDKVTLIAKTTGGGSSPKYTWKRNNIIIQGYEETTANEYEVTSAVNGEEYTVEMKSNATCITGNDPDISKLVTVVPSVSIGPRYNSINKGESKTLFAYPEGATTPSYVWKVNGIAKATTRAFTTENIEDQEKISVEMSTMYCTDTNVLSDILPPMNVTYCSPSVNINQVFYDNECGGKSISFAGQPEGGENPTYQWKINDNIQEGETDRIFTPIHIKYGQKVTVEMSSSCMRSGDVVYSDVLLENSIVSKNDASIDIYADTKKLLQNSGQINLYSNMENEGPSPNLQWFISRNETDISIPETGGHITITTLQENDLVYCKLEACGVDIVSNALLIQNTDMHQNYIKTVKPLNAQGLYPNENNSLVSYEVLDDLGRPMQQIAIDATPAGNNIITPIKYDNLGRQPKEYLPFSYNDVSRDIYIENDIEKQKAYYSTVFSEDVMPDGVYAEKDFEDSPLNRILEQGFPGKAWQFTDTPANDKTKRFIYRADSENEVPLWVFNNPSSNVEFGSVSFSEYYRNTGEEAQLYVTEVVDEEKSKALEYKDKLGNVILKTVLSEDGSIEAKTYYIYDDFGLLRFVFPPEMNKVMGTPNSVPQDLLDKWAYQYNYDTRNRMIAKKLPGSEPVYMVYDNRDRLVATQDGNMRSGTESLLANSWLFTKYDAFNRPVLTGITVKERSQAEMQTEVNDFYAVSGSIWFESAGTDVHGYTNLSYPIVSSENAYLTVSYYDNYNEIEFLPTIYGIKASPVLDDTDGNNVPDEYFSEAKGLVTATKTKVLDGNNTWLKTVNYYDKKGRVIQVISDVYQSGVEGQDILSTAYNFIGQPVSTEYVHNGKEQVTILKRYQYDRAGRLLKVFHKINNEEEILMSYMRYNEQGELKEKNIHASDVTASEQANFTQSIDYRYNIRGWLKNINNSTLSNDPETGNDDTNDLFGFDIFYNNPLSE